ncbi:MAG: hypothetical protein WCW35_10505 [Bacteroidota bacterium]
MKDTTNINIPRVLLGGIAAGVIVFISNGIVNGAILSSDFQNWAAGMGSLLHPPEQSISMSLWALMCLIHGIAGVWLYAGMRPRFGAGAKTALLAGFFLWTVCKFTASFDFIALGILPGKIITGQIIGSFVGILIGVFVGALLYKEE